MNGNLRQENASQTNPPRVRSHTEELAARIDAVESWLAQRCPRSEIIELARTQWGISMRQTDRYIAQATARWLDRSEPERETCRRRNLATVDTGIAHAFRERRLRDVAPLVRLRAMLDGSLSTLPSVLPPLPAPEPPPVSVPMLLQSLGELVKTEASAGHYDEDMRREMSRLLDGLAAAIREPPSPVGIDGRWPPQATSRP